LEAACAVLPEIDGKTLTFEAQKGDDKSVKIVDKETGSQWSVEGVAVAGPMAGKKLTRLDCHLSQWYGWSAYFPETSIYGSNDPPKPGDPFAKPAANPAPK